jgi:hypothetical protein
MMSLYGGIDLHANNSVAVLLNEQDQVIEGVSDLLIPRQMATPNS